MIFIALFICSGQVLILPTSSNDKKLILGNFNKRIIQIGLHTPKLPPFFEIHSKNLLFPLALCGFAAVTSKTHVAHIGYTTELQDAHIIACVGLMMLDYVYSWSEWYDVDRLWTDYGLSWAEWYDVHRL